MLCTLVSLVIAHFIRYKSFHGVKSIIDNDDRYIIMYLIAFLIYAVYVIATNPNFGFFKRGILREFLSCLTGTALFSVLVILLFYGNHHGEGLSRLVIGYYSIINFFITFIVRNIIKLIMFRNYRNSKYSRKLVVITERKTAKKVIRNITDAREWNRNFEGVIIADDEDYKETEIEDKPVLTSSSDLMNYITRHSIDDVFFCVRDIAHNDYLKSCASRLKDMGVTVYLDIDEFQVIKYATKHIDQVGSMTAVAFARNEQRYFQLALKRATDIVGSLVGLVLFGIAFIIVGPMIKIESPGPILFKQKRVGKNGRMFYCYKFRSMYQDAEERKKELMAKNEMNGLMFKMTDDPRITKVGKFIRKTSIDELPQFINIFQGDMSLVGTRPPTVDEYNRYEPEHKARLSMKPGLTGMWQVSGRSSITDFDEIVSLDMEYIDDWNYIKDIKILFKTVFVVLMRSGAK